MQKPHAVSQNSYLLFDLPLQEPDLRCADEFNESASPDLSHVLDDVVCSVNAVRRDTPAIPGLGAAHHQNLAKEDVEFARFFCWSGAWRSRLSVH